MPESISSELDEIELRYIGENPVPAVSLKTRVDNPLSPSPFRPSGPTFELLSGFSQSRRFEGCETPTERVSHITTIHLELPLSCSLRLPLLRQGRLLDALSYATLHLRGTAIGRATFSLTDHETDRGEDHVPFITVTGPFDLHVSLKDVGRRLDLRRLSVLVVKADGGDVQLTLEECTLIRETDATMSSPRVGFWVWDYHAAITDPHAMIKACLNAGCSRLLIQIPSISEDEPLWASYATLFPFAKARNIDVFALDGYPEAIQEPGALVAKLKRLLTLVDKDAIAGVQVDIEPYLVPGFFADASGPRRYLETIDHLKEAIAGRTRLSVVMPFWFTSPTVQGRPIAYSVMDRVDEVAIMSYRTEIDEIQAIADDTLRYGALAQVPVWLALETTPLPVERYVALRREGRPELADAYVDVDRHRLVMEPPPSSVDRPRRLIWFRVHHRVTIRPGRVTFAGRSRTEVRAMVKTIIQETRNRSLAGVLIHDLKGFLALQE
ncbi:MAG TPA: hypothetical protein VLA67_14155 [Nitrospiraceae bacterium]|nr:hypothetical protein [Nitrospiraceae bacterium]